MAKFLVLGKNGQVGWELQRALALHGEVLCLGRHDEGGDLSSPEKVATSILKFSPNAVFNAAAYTAVDKAETDNEEAYLITALDFLDFENSLEKFKAESDLIVANRFAPELKDVISKVLTRDLCVND